MFGIYITFPQQLQLHV